MHIMCAYFALGAILTGSPGASLPPSFGYVVQAWGFCTRSGFVLQATTPMPVARRTGATGPLERACITSSRVHALIDFVQRQIRGVTRRSQAGQFPRVVSSKKGESAVVG